jgi:hypothetical protein
MFSWNLLGVLLWAAVILYLVFVIQNVRRRHIKMIITKHQRFSGSTLLLDLLEIVVLFLAAGWLFAKTALDNPDLEDQSLIKSHVSYSPLILTPDSRASYYVTISSAKRKVASQSYTFYRAGSKNTVSSNNATIAEGRDPLTVDAQKIPYSAKQLQQMDKKYQRAYVAVYTATYRNIPQNGLGLHANHVASRYYLIRVPDQSFVRQH